MPEGRPAHRESPLPSAGSRPGSRKRSRWRLVVPVTMGLAGVLFVVSAVSSGGSDLRPATTDLRSLVKDRTVKVEQTREEAEGLRDEVDSLSSSVDTIQVAEQRKEINELKDPAGLTEVEGEGMRVVLTDAPDDVVVPGLDPNLLVVHQQDIQAFVNALWSGGAQAITLQGQRLISTTGIKCVGSTVVLDGIPYSPPYEIEAVGNRSDLALALATSGSVNTYRDYVEKYELGLAVEDRPDIVAPAYSGTIDLSHAEPLN